MVGLCVTDGFRIAGAEIIGVADGVFTGDGQGGTAAVKAAATPVPFGFQHFKGVLLSLGHLRIHAFMSQQTHKDIIVSLSAVLHHLQGGGDQVLPFQQRSHQGMVLEIGRLRTA